MSLGSILKPLIRKGTRRFGYEIRRYHPAVFPDAQLAALLGSQRINLVLDVGANTGQFGKYLREIGYAGRIVSFEPLTQARERLVGASSGDPAWLVADRCAVGEREGEIEIHVSANSVSSSALQMLDAHLNSAPESRYVGAERVPLRRLDQAAKPYLEPGSVVLLKVDTQGYEDRVLEGAAQIVPSIAAIQLELSLVPLYEGQQLLPEMLQRLQRMGFALCAIWPAFVEADSGKVLQVDATFLRVANR